MVGGTAHGGAPAGVAANGRAPAVSTRRLPPVAQLAVASMTLIVIGGITLAARLPRTPPLALETGLLAAAALVLAVDILLLTRLRPFAWRVFFQVSGWALLAYAVISGMLEFTFVYDHVRGSTLVVLTLMLAVFAVDIPLLLGFSVARYQDPDQ